MNIIRKLLVAFLLTTGLSMAASAATPANNLPDLGGASRAAQAKEALAKEALCTRCHDENEVKPVLSIYQTKHGVKGDARTPTCQACHGESEKHLKGDPAVKGRPAPDIIFKKGTFKASDEKSRAAPCLTCHEGGKRTNWDGGKHQTGGLACNDCHVAHQPADKLLNRKTQTEVCFTCHKEQRADSKKISHHPLGEGKVVCSDCHNPHGSAGPKLLKKNTVTETCYTCHAEKRGPFLWEHQPVTEDCANCHNPHGSNIAPLLKSRAPFLCQECHDGPHNSQSPFAGVVAGIQGGLTVKSASTVPGTPSNVINPSSSAAGRACMNCHVMVHGSNSPSGAFLHR
jgi:DmsE family decaheme c-type cytochrome